MKKKIAKVAGRPVYWGKDGLSIETSDFQYLRNLSKKELAELRPILKDIFVDALIMEDSAKMSRTKKAYKKTLAGIVC